MTKEELIDYIEISIKIYKFNRSPEHKDYYQTDYQMAHRVVDKYYIMNDSCKASEYEALYQYIQKYK